MADAKYRDSSPVSENVNHMNGGNGGFGGDKNNHGGDHHDEDVFLFPASYGQQRMWFLDQFEPGSPYYNIPLAFRLIGSFNVNVFRRVIEEIVARHESLRTTFTAIDGKPMQVISTTVKVEVPLIDISDLPEGEREAKVLELARQEARTGFNLEKGPLFRAKIIRVAPQDHVVLITMHHIISDGWSVGILVNEITTLYAAFIQGKPSPLPELEIQYADYAEWQREFLKGEPLQKQLEYWKNQLAGAPDVLELPTDRPRPPVYTNVGSSESMTISAELTRQLETLSRKEGVTMFMLLVAAFKVLLHRYSRQDDICVGTPVANRRQEELEKIIGLFINTLVLRTDLSNNPTFRELLQRVKNVTLEAYAHQDIPFEMIVDSLQLDRDMSHTPLFQVMFILQNAPVKAHALPGVQLQQINVDMGTSTFDLTFSISQSSQGMSVSVEYNTDLFDASTIKRMLAHYHTLLQSVVANPDERIGMLNILPEEERQKVLWEWNQTEEPRPEDLCVHHLFEYRALENPDAPAVAHLGRYLSYAELNQKANQLAHYLIRAGVQPEVKVGICMDKSLEMIVAVLGVMKAGGAYVPIDPAYPQERIAYMLEDSGVPILLTSAEVRASLPEFSGNIIAMDAEWEEISGEADNNPAIPMMPDNLVYMIYTSGTTGKAKGTMITHRSLVNAYFGWEKVFGLRNSKHAHLQMANFSFDVFSGDFVRALCSGGKLVLVPREYLLDAPRLYQLMLQEKITIAEFVPAVLRNLIQHLEDIDQKLDFMRVLIAGSDVWYVNEYQKFLNFIGPNTRLLNTFGLTEATIDSSYFEAKDLNLPQERLVPIGVPFPNTRIYILDEFLNPVPIGVPGEVCVGGLNLARGYHNRPELTAEKFVANPYGGNGERLYRTGDLARFLPDGNIEFLGRIDHQVKIRGFRIELGEVETALTKHPGVKEGVVIVREDAPGDKRLVGYVVPHEPDNFSVNQLRQFLLEKLPDYMVPSAFVVLEQLPLTPNGKIDRKALPKPDRVVREEDESFVPPRNDLEEKIASVWQEVLGVEQVSVLDNFFLIGGHSLLATQLVSRLREVCQVEVPLRKVFETPTVAGLAAYIESAQRVEKGLEAPPIVPVPRDQELPLSFAQERLWFLDQLEPNSPFYNIPEAFRIKGKVDFQLLEKAVNEVLRRHESLRTTFHAVDGKPHVQIHDALQISLEIEDYRKLPAKEKEAAILELLHRTATTPIPLDTLPLFRVKVARESNTSNVIILVMHHIISDDWSIKVLMREIAVIYNALRHHQPVPLPELKIQYADYAHWQRNWLKGEVLEAHLDFWKNYLKDAPPLLELPTDKPRPAVQTYNGSYETFRLPRDLSQKLEEIGNAVGATPFMTFMAAFQTLLYRYSGQDDICIGTPIANRTRKEVENLIGFFVNTLVLRTKLDGRPTFRELLERVKKNALDAYAYQDVPFEKVVEAVQPERSLSHSPLFQVMFALQNTPVRGEQVSDLQIEPLSIHSGTAKFDLTLFMVKEGERYSGALEYNTDLFTAETIQRMLNHFRNLLEGIAGNPDQPIDHIPLLSQDEQHIVLEAWNGRAEPLAFEVPVHQRFERIARVTPGSTAVVFEEQTLSYAELNEKANQLANFLRKRGVGPDVPVGISLPRSPELVIAILAVLKAGGAYVPIDPSYPEDRLRYMIEDSGIQWLITQSTVKTHTLVERERSIYLDKDWPRIARSSRKNPRVLLQMDNLAYIIYTSGSTGRPKGTMITHRGLTNYLSWVLTAYPIAEGRGTLVHSTVAFDATVTALFPPLLIGKRLQLLPEGNDVEALSQAIKTGRKYSLLKITPAHLELLSQQLSPEEARQAAHALIIGGENLTYDQIRFWQENAPEVRLFNEYGPTETVVGCVVYEVPSEEKQRGSVPIGRAIPNMRVYVLDEQLQPVPIGVPGELYISGEGVARGYLNRPDLTAERFLPDPFSPEPGARMYKTGDRVRYRSDGLLEFLERLDDQVKIRGYRVELGEIESLLAAHPRVNEAVVVLRTIRGDARLIAYYTSPEGEQDPATLREYLKRQLPEYMIPMAFVHVDAIPLTPNGKVDRKALPDPEKALSRSIVQKTYVAPRNATEETLAELWQEILGLERVGVHDDFFELGGHSLLVTQLASRIEKIFNIKFPVRLLFEATTIVELAETIEQNRLQGQVQSPPIEPVSRKEKLPLSFQQQRLWFLDKLDPGQTIYNMPFAVKLEGQLDIERFKESIQAVVQRHEALRTIFAEEDGQPIQIILPELTVNIPVDDLRALPKKQREIEARQIFQREANTPFNLSRGPLFRTRLIHLTDERYMVVFTMHHIISDGWSVNLLVQEVAAMYSVLARGISVPLPELKIQYADYAVWQRNWLQGKVLEEQLNYWKKTLSGAPPLLELPTDRPRPPVKTFNGDHISFTLPEELVTHLSHFARKENVTNFMLLLAAFNVLLYRYSGQDDISVGTPIANRTREELENIIGFFANTLVMRTDLSGRPSFRELLQRVRQTALGAYAHQDIPFEKLVEVLAPERDLSYTPLFQVMFVLQNTNVVQREFQLPGLRMIPVESESTAVQYDLTLSMEVSGNQWSGTFEYNTDLFDSGTIKRMIDHFRHLLEAIVRYPDVSVGQLDILSETEKYKILHEWRPAQSSEGLDHPAHRIFEQIVAQNPNAIALEDDQGELTYKELNDHANRVAHWLRKRGIANEVVVGVSMERNRWAVIGLLGILKAGAVYLPLDGNYPEERLRYMIQDSGVQVILTDDTIGQRLVEMRLGVGIVSLESDWQAIAAFDSSNPDWEVLPDQLAYIIYTSGSTGWPKGVMLAHRGLINLVKNQTREFQVTSSSKVLQFASLSFDASISEIFMALFTGARLVLIPQALLKDISYLHKILQEKAISVVTLPPSVLSVLPAENLPHLHTIISAGERCNWALVHRWGKERRFVNAYGPTESTVGVCNYVVEGEYQEKGSSVPIGRGYQNLYFYILDEEMNPVPIGVAGELYIGGVQLARGYFGRPELTAERFVPDPYSETPGARLYRTGDLVRWLPDGHIEFLGRVDDQVKVRGFRIELGEIEAQLQDHPQVEESAVVVRGDRLVGYAVLKEAHEISGNELREYLRQRLPEYMVPSAIMVLDAFPLTPNGKIDRKALPEPQVERDESHVPYVPPRTPTEELLVEMWKEVLNEEKVGVLDNFFDLGGHSLMVTQVMSRIQSVFGVELPIRTMFESPTISHIARTLDRLKEEKAGRAVPPIVPVPRDGKIPLSLAQQRLWFLNILEPGNTFYNLSTALKIKGKLNLAALEKSFAELIRRHESLRTTFAMVDGEPVQVIHPFTGFELPVEDLTSLPVEERKDRAFQIVNEEALTPFDLEAGPLFRVRLVKLAKETYLIAVTMHHIISDGWSINIIIQEIGQLYQAFSEGRPSPLPELTIQYADFAVWQRNWLQGEVLQEQINYWKETLSGAPPLLKLPTDRPRPPVKTFNGNRQAFKVDARLTRQLMALARQYDVTPFMMLLAAFNVLLYRYSGQEDIVVGTPIANRNRLETERIVGFFANTLVMRGDLSGRPTFKELLQRIREQALGAYAHQDIPFEKLVEILAPERDLSYTPIFQVMFVLQNNPQRGVALSDITLQPVEVDTRMTQFDLTLSMEESESGLTGWFEFNTDLFNPETISRMIGHFQRLLASIALHPELPVGLLEMLDKDEKETVLLKWQPAQEKDLPAFTAPQWFERIVNRYPDAIAVEDDQGVLTYAELNEQVNQMARWLQNRGITMEDHIGVSMERSRSVVISLLAILKAGAVYVPLDRHYPDERLRYMIQDSDVKMILTDHQTFQRLSRLNVNVPLINLAEQWQDIKQLQRHNLNSYPVQEQSAYIIYTSGSTGWPKGVKVPHRGLMNLVRNQTREFRVGNNSRVLQFASLSFDASISEIFMALLTGARLVLLPQQQIQDVVKLPHILKERKISVVTLPPSVLSVMPQIELPDLKTLISAGERCDWELVRRWGIGRRFVNAYGPTESSVGVCNFVVETDIDEEGSSVPIGKAYHNVRLYVLDEEMNPVPIGVAGELYIGGIQLAHGYHNRPDLTAERFVPDPFSNEPGSRLYRTGDLVRWLADGNLEFLGRIDEQVKVRGFRIELGEIEAQLLTHPAVKESVVTVREDQLFAYVVLHTGQEVTSTNLKTYLQERLPEYMVPSAVMVLESFPLTPNGKVDRKALPTPQIDRETKQVEYVPPRDEIETELAEIWKENLNLKKVGVLDNFFDLGGHSILAVRLLTQIEDKFNREISMVEFFQNPTIEGLATHIRTTEDSDYLRKILVKFHDNGGERPIFFIHPSGGSVHWYTFLAEALGDAIPFYGIQAVGTDGKVEPHHTIEQMASFYIAAMRQRQPAGPYVFGSWSMGVVIAYEVARQLTAMGETVERVILLDQGPDLPQAQPEDSAEFLSRMFMGRLNIPVEKLREMDYDEQLKFVLKKAKKAKIFPRFLKLERFKIYVKILKIQQDAWRIYKPRPFPGKVTLIRSSERVDPPGTPRDLGWSRLAKGGVEIYEVTGDHNTILHKPNVQELANLLLQLLRNREESS